MPPAGLKLDLSRGDVSKSEASRPAASKPATRSPQPSAYSPARGSSLRSQAAAPSWWTARAREGEVKPGFTKAEILRPAKEDPRAPGGVFERVGGLLSELLEQV